MFGERVSIDAEANGVEIYGGFSCADWTYDATAKTSVVSPTPLALHIVEADDAHALQLFLWPGFKRCTATITPVIEHPVDKG